MQTNNRIRHWDASIVDAEKEIRLFQSGAKKPLDTGIDHLNENSIGGIYNNDIILIGGLPAMGKTYFLSQIENNIMDNMKGNVVLVRYNFEMSVQKLALRRLKIETKLSMSDLLLKEPVDEAQFKRILDKEKNPNIYHIQKPTTPEEFREDLIHICEENKDKDNILVSVDHMALFKKGRDGKKDAIDSCIEICIEIRQNYSNITFLLLSQLNREIYSRTNPVEAAPRMSDFYASSTINFAADIAIVVHRPQLLGFTRYLSLDKEQYDYLKDFFVAGSSDKYASLNPYKAVFYHYVKLRTIDEDDYRDVFASHIGGFKPAASPKENSSTINSIQNDENDLIREKSSRIEAF